MADSLPKRFKDWLDEKEIRATSGRIAVAEHLAGHDGHPSLSDLSDALRGKVSKVTVYRTVRLLEEAELVDRLEVEGVDRYEATGEHHDHLICVDCGRVDEFHSEAIEARQHEVARELGFEVTGHTHILRGRCPECRKARRDTSPS